VKNILHVIETCGPGGAETVFLELAKGLDRRRWHSIVAVPGRGWVYDNLVANGFEPILTPLHGAFDLRYLAGLCQAVRKHQIDLIQTHLFSAAVYGGLAGRLCGVPVISTLHGRPDLFGSAIYRAAKFVISDMTSSAGLRRKRRRSRSMMAQILIMVADFSWARGAS